MALQSDINLTRWQNLKRLLGACYDMGNARERDTLKSILDTMTDFETADEEAVKGLTDALIEELIKSRKHK